MKVYSTPCKNCLFHANRIVPNDQAGRIMSDCAARDTHFVCHVGEGGQMVSDARTDGEVCCRGFYDQHRDANSPLFGAGKMLRLATALGVVEFVDVPDTRMLPPDRKWGR